MTSNGLSVLVAPAPATSPPLNKAEIDLFFRQSSMLVVNSGVLLSITGWTLSNEIPIFIRRIRGYEKIKRADGSSILSIIPFESIRDFENEYLASCVRFQSVYGRLPEGGERLGVYFGGTGYGSEPVSPLLFTKGAMTVGTVPEAAFDVDKIGLTEPHLYRPAIIMEENLEYCPTLDANIQLECFYNGQWNVIADTPYFANQHGRRTGEGIVMNVNYPEQRKQIVNLFSRQHQLFRLMPSDGSTLGGGEICMFHAVGFDRHQTKQGDHGIWFDVDRLSFHGREVRDLLREKHLEEQTLLSHLKEKNRGVYDLLATRFTDAQIATMTADVAARFVLGMLGVPFAEFDKVLAVYKLFSQTSYKVKHEVEWLGEVSE